MDLDIVLALTLVCGIMYWALTREHFTDEFEDKSNRERTDKLVRSTYEQTTNHAIPESKFFAGPLHGTETAYRVNMWNSYL